MYTILREGENEEKKTTGKQKEKTAGSAVFNFVCGLLCAEIARSGKRQQIKRPCRFPLCAERAGSYAFAASMIAVNLSVFSDAPPISPPSTLAFASSSAALPSFIDPPYWITISSAAFSE